jgi:hypothetical protein
MRLDTQDMYGGDADSAEPTTSDCCDEDEEEEEYSDEDELQRRKVNTAYTSAEPTVFAVDYAPEDLLFADRVPQTLAAFAAVSAVPLATRRLQYEEYEAEWRQALGDLHLFPAYLVATPSGVYTLGGGSFLRQMYILQVACSV